MGKWVQVGKHLFLLGLRHSVWVRFVTATPNVLAFGRLAHLAHWQLTVQVASRHHDLLPIFLHQISSIYCSSFDLDENFIWSWLRPGEIY